jgi:hypothetical protein
MSSASARSPRERAARAATENASGSADERILHGIRVQQERRQNFFVADTKRDLLRSSNQVDGVLAPFPHAQIRARLPVRQASRDFLHGNHQVGRASSLFPKRVRDEHIGGKLGRTGVTQFLRRDAIGQRQVEINLRNEYGEARFGEPPLQRAIRRVRKWYPNRVREHPPAASFTSERARVSGASAWSHFVVSIAGMQPPPEISVREAEKDTD